MYLSQFFGVPLHRVHDDSEDLTILRIAKETDNGVSFENVVLEKENNSLVGLDFRDFTITNLLKAGIKPSALHIESDHRFGLESEIKRFNDFVDEKAEEIFTHN